MVLTTGRMLEHWHTGSHDAARRRRSIILEPEAIAGLNPREMERIGIAPGEPRARWRRGAARSP